MGVAEGIHQVENFKSQDFLTYLVPSSGIRPIIRELSEADVRPIASEKVMIEENNSDGASTKNHLTISTTISCRRQSFFL